MNEQNQQGQTPENGVEHNTQGAPETARLASQPADAQVPPAQPDAEPTAQPTAPTQRIEAQRGADAAADAAPASPVTPVAPGYAPAAQDAVAPARQVAEPTAQPTAQPTAPTQRIEAPTAETWRAPIADPAARHDVAAAAAAAPAAPQPAAYGTQPGGTPSGTTNPWGQTGYGFHAAPQVAPGQQQSNPYASAYPQAWAQPGQRPKAPMSPRKRKGLRWGAAAGALALAVTLGAVPGWAFGHQAGTAEAQAQAQAEAQNRLPSDGNSRTNPFGDGNGSNGSQGNQNDGGTFGNGGLGNGNQGNGGQQYNQLPFGDYGNGSRNRGNNSSVEQGDKLDGGLAGMVMVDTTLNGGSGAGTGMILTDDGYVLTNYHVVEASTEVKVTDSTTGKSYTAEVVGRDASHDVALLKLKDASGLKTVSMATGTVNEGDGVHAVGNASGEGYLRKLSGKVTATQQSITTQSEMTSEGEKLNNLIETDADVVPGYSGGALMNDAGQVVGMTTAASSGNTSATVDGYAIPISEALDIVNKIKAGESSDTIQIGRAAALGISVLSSDTGQVGGGYGVTVQEIIDGGAVAKSGLAAGDTIIGLDGKNVKSYSALKEILSGHRAGDKVELTWLNASGQQKSAEVTLGESSVN